MLKLSAREVRSHRSLDSCWVVRDGRVFDVTRFVRMHPGGETALLRRAGADVGRAMRGAPHKHSHNAYRWLEQYCIGELAEGDDGDEGEEPQQVEELEPAVTESNGVSSEKSGLEPDTSTDIEVTYKTVSTENDLVDWSKPLLWQVGHLREKYDEWVHQPVDRHIRLFGSDLVESWTKTSWYVVPSVWLPVVLLWSVWCNRELARGDTALHPPLLTNVSVPVGQELFPFLFLLGMFIWSFVEYSLHRFLFHMTPPANNYYLITLHFLLHGQHHKSPFDGSRLVFPPLPASLFVALFYIGFRLALPSAVTGSLMVGGLAGYVIYDLTHYYLHYGAPRRGTYLYHLKAYHVKHHFEHQKLGFGITSKLWDFPFQTLIPKETFEKSH